MKTLRSIINRTYNDSLKVLQSFVNKYAKNKYKVTKEHLYWLFFEVSKQFNDYEPYKVSQNFKLYEIPFEYLRAYESKTNEAVEIIVNVADFINSDGDEFITHYGLFKK